MMEDILATARKVLKRGDGLNYDQGNYDRIRAECERLGVFGEVRMLSAIRQAFGEITAKQLHQRRDTSWSGLYPDQTLFECRWPSGQFSTVMYLKFALSADGYLEMLSFHENRPKG